MNSADTMVVRSLPWDRATKLLVVGLFRRPRSRFATAPDAHAIAEAAAKKAAEMALADGIGCEWQVLGYGSWAEVADSLRSRRPGLLVLPWRHEPELEALTASLRREHFAGLLLVCPAPDHVADSPPWTSRRHAERPWIP